MIDISQQPWWADVLVISLPVLVYLTAREVLRRNRCKLCRHKATKAHKGKLYCEACYRKQFGHAMPTVQIPAAVAAALPKLRPLAAGKKKSRKGEAHHGRNKRSA